MAALKQVNRCATTAFCPTAPLLAVGTMAGAVDLSFSTTACLEIFRLDLAHSTKRELAPAGGAVATTERFHRLAWSPSGVETGELPLGLIAGGLVDGTVNLWNPAQIVGAVGSEEPGSAGDGALVANLQKHSGAVKGLQFNPFSPNLLASGAADGELCIWDVASPASPTLFPALKGGAGPGGGAGEVTFLAWNCKVQHILASTSAAGTTVVWDLKRQRPVISFTDPNGARRCSALAWNPEVATQLITASDDDRATTLQVWDLRNSISPAREFVGHSKGVLAMSWCTADTSLLLTCGKDNRTLCWDAPAGEVVAELPASSNWNFDVQWSPRTPGLLSASSFDGSLGVYNLLEASAPQDPTAASFGGVAAGTVPMRRAPAWLRRPCGASFGFGGRLVAFGVRREDGSTPAASEVEVRHVGLSQAEAAGPPGGEVAASDAEFQAAVGAGDREALKAFCDVKAAAATQVAAEAEAETWAFLRVLLDGDNARRLLLQHLKYADAIAPAPEDVKPVEDGADAAATGAAAAPESLRPDPSPAAAAGDDGLDFFENLPNTPKSPVAEEVDAAVSAHSAGAAPATGTAVEHIDHADADGDDAPDTEADVAIQRALVVGNYGGAVAACMRAGRLGDALVLASVGGTELWLRTQAEYMRLSRRPYMKVVTAVVKNDLDSLVRQRPLAAWRETLAILCTYAPTAEWGAMAGVLAARLEHAGSAEAAVLCHICAGNIDAAVRHWVASVEFTGGAASLEALRRVVEKSVVLAHTTGERASSAALTGVVNTYADLLAVQGRLDQALSYLSLVPGDDSPDTAVLRDRIYGSRSAAVAAQHPVQQPHVYAQQPATASQPSRPAQQLQPAAYVTAPAVPPPPSQPQRLVAPQHSYAPPPAQAYVQPSYATQPQQAPQQAPPPQQTYAPPPPAYAPPPPPQQSYAPPPQQPMAYASPQAGHSPYASPSLAGAYAPPPAVQQQPAAFAAAAPAGSAAPPPPAAPAARPQAFMPQAAPPPPAGSPHLFVPAPPSAPPAGPPSQQPRFQPAAAAPPPQAPAPAPRVFQPGVSVPTPAADPVPQASAPAPPAPPANVPPANISMENVSTSGVAPEARPVVQSLTALYGACLAAVGGNASKKREMEDSSKRLGALLWKLNRQDVTPGVVAKLAAMCAALDKGDHATVGTLQVQLTSSDWDECSAWMPALKRLSKTRAALH